MSKSLRKEIEHWLHLAHKVWHYRRDLLGEGDTAELSGAIEDVRNAADAKGKLEQGTVRPKLDRLEKILAKTGGKFYPHPGRSENTEMFLVAAILAIGLRTFFFQPFKIPTNSMYPTYHGMTHQVYEQKADMPSMPVQLFRKVAFWATPRTLEAPADGEVLVPVVVAYEEPGNGRRAFDARLLPWDGLSGRNWQWQFIGHNTTGRNLYVLPARKAEYTFMINGRESAPASIQVPADFSMQKVINEALFGHDPVPPNHLARERNNWFMKRAEAGNVMVADNGQLFLKTGKFVKQGESFLNFEILTGDALFVDRMSYHFVAPKIGDPFVFRTRDIPGIMKVHSEETYYIKRCAGEPGDVIEIRPPKLYVNGKPADMKMPFVKNGEQDGEYEGYIYLQNMQKNVTVTLPENYYFALGDNSDESLDSRAWGFVPEHTIVGRAIFLYHPFGKRWGPAQ